MGYTVSVAMNARMPDGSDAVEVEKLKKMKIDFFQIDFDTKNPLSRDNVIAYKQLKKVVNEEYDLIHCHTPIVGILTRMAAKKYRKTGTTVIYTTHGFTFTDKSSKKNWIVYFNAEKLMSRFCDAIITINHEDYNNAKRMHPPLIEKPVNQKPSLHQMEHYQKFYENGEYVRAVESTTEQNYNMIDGCANNLPKPRIINGRESVLDKLRIRQMAREKQKSRQMQEQSTDIERNRK